MRSESRGALERRYTDALHVETEIGIFVDGAPGCREACQFSCRNRLDERFQSFGSFSHSVLVPWTLMYFLKEQSEMRGRNRMR